MYSSTQQQLDDILNGLNEAQQGIVKKRDGKYLVLASAGSGKALVNNSPVQTPNGPIAIGDIKVGEPIYGTDGSVYHVEGVYPQEGNRTVWEVTLKDGTIIECDGDHLWSYYLNSPFDTLLLTKTTKEIAQDILDNTYHRFFLPEVAAVPGTPRDLSIMPYFMGVLLMSESISQDSILMKNNFPNRVRVLKGLEEYFTDSLTLDGLLVDNKINPKLMDYLTYYHLMDTDITERRIPSDYLTASIEQRLSLLRGIIMAASIKIGELNRLTIPNNKLLQDIKNLAGSLGIIAHIKEEPLGEYQWIDIYWTESNYTGKECLYTPDHTNKGICFYNQGSLREIISIHETERKAKMTCITTSAPNSLFLTTDYTPTHNTRVLTSRVAYLLASGVKPWQIMAISFTRKASGELQERIVNQVGDIGLDVHTGTFHSICIRILLANQAALGMTNLTVLSEDESKRIVTELAQNYGYDKDGAAEIYQKIGRWSSENKFAKDVVDEDIHEDYKLIYKNYEEYKQQVGYVDFDDILLWTNRLFEMRPDILERYSSKYSYIMVDEAQDLNNLQVSIAEKLFSVNQNIMYVADDLQLIYSFRGSNIQNILNIRENKEFETLYLERNYRSTNNIIQASNAVIANNKKQLEKVSYTEREEGYPIMVYESDDDLRESDFVVDMIKGLVNQSNYDYDDVVILYRSNFLAQNIGMALSSAGIPYEMQNAVNYYDREEIKTLVGYLRVLENDLDDVALEYIINRPKRSIGDTTINRLKMHANELNVSLYMALQYVDDVAKINKPTKQRIKNFVNFIERGKKLTKSNASVIEILEFILEETELMKEYDISRTKDIERLEHIQELFNIAANFTEKEKEELTEGQTILTQFLTETALYVLPNSEDDKGRVRLLTVHSAKGLESPIVFMIGCQDGAFPSNFSKNNIDEYEEERRLWYVAMTRAENILFITHSRNAYRYGKVEVQSPSPFIAEIPEQYVKFIGK